MFGKETQEWQENNGIYTATEIAQQPNKWKKTILLAGMIYKNQILKSLYSPFIEFEYKKFIDNIKSMQ